MENQNRMVYFNKCPYNFHTRCIFPVRQLKSQRPTYAVCLFVIPLITLLKVIFTEKQ